MWFRMITVSALLIFPGLSATAQEGGVVGDIISGSLINPENGVFAWYDVRDVKTGKQFFMRQAIVGEEKVKGKNGYWLETEVVPQVGFPIVYKMLITGPASDPANIQEVYLKDGPGEPEKLTLDPGATDTGQSINGGKRTSAGMEALETPQGPIEAEHILIERDGITTEVWISDQARPTGIVKMVSPEGELILRRFGVGGADAVSAFERKDGVSDEKSNTKVVVKVNGQVKEPEQKGETTPEPPKPEEAKKPAQKDPPTTPATGEKKPETGARKNFAPKKPVK